MVVATMTAPLHQRPAGYGRVKARKRKKQARDTPITQPLPFFPLFFWCPANKGCLGKKRGQKTTQGYVLKRLALFLRLCVVVLFFIVWVCFSTLRDPLCYANGQPGRCKQRSICPYGVSTITMLESPSFDTLLPFLGMATLWNLCLMGCLRHPNTPRLCYLTYVLSL